MGATRRSCFDVLGSLKNLTIGQGGVDGGGHQRAVWEQQGVHWFHLLGSLKNLTIGLIWLAWGVWAREAGKGA